LEPNVKHFFPKISLFLKKIFNSLNIVSFPGNTINMFTSKSTEQGQEPFHPTEKVQYPFPISEQTMGEIFQDCDDYQSRQVRLRAKTDLQVTVCWLDGLTAGGDISEDVLRPLTQPDRMVEVQTEDDAIRRIVDGAVYSYAVNRRDQCDDAVKDLLNGCCAILFDQSQTAVTFEVKSDKMRSISEPSLEKTVKGARDAFIETLRVNTSLVRKKLRTAKLKSVETVIGRKSGTAVSVMYVDGVAEDHRVQTLLEKLDKIQIDGLTASGYLEQYIVDQPGSPFPQLLHTERPDTFANYLLEGRIGILVDGLPIGFVVPAPFTQFMKVSEDNAQHFTVASMLILLRYAAFLFALFLPAVYVAIAMYHQEMLPTKLLISIIDAKQQVPFSTAVEILGMLVAFELLQEAGLRLPSPVGDTVSIIGALIVGQSAVDARIISPIAVIIVAFSGISSYTLPSQDLASALRVLRLLLVFAAMAAGIFGVMSATALLVWHLCSLDSYGVSYLYPFVDGTDGGWLWSLLRKPLWKEKFRNPVIAGQDVRKQK